MTVFSPTEAIARDTIERRAWPAIAGPVNRESFDDAQRRHRWSARVLTAILLPVVVLTSVPLALFSAPALWAAIIIVLDVASVVVATPDATDWFEVGDLIAGGRLEVGDLGARALLVVSPGVILIVLAWIGVRRVVLRSGTPGALAAIGVRDPDRRDVEERQLENVVEEMAIAAGLPTPRIAVLDARVVNAAALGRSPRDAVVVVSRQLLDRYDRSETTGVIANRVAAIGNGDLRLSMVIVSVLLTFRTVVVAIGGPASKTNRRRAWRLLTAPLRPRRDAALEAAVIEAVLSEDDPDDESEFFLSLPFTMLRLGLDFIRWFSCSLLAGPLLALLWRTRCHLADAGAVELTRYPDGLARSLLHLAGAGEPAPGSTFSSHLFVVGAPAPADERSGSVGSSSVFSILPSVGRRLARLQRMGSTVPPPARPRVDAGPLRWTIGFALTVPVLLFAVLVMAATFVVLCALTIFAGLLVLAPVLVAHPWLRVG